MDTIPQLNIESKQKMKKNTQKSVKNQHFLTFFVLFLFFFVNSCNFHAQKGSIHTDSKRIDCKWNPDYENLADEALNSLDDMKRINLMQLKAACNF